MSINNITNASGRAERRDGPHERLLDNIDADIANQRSRLRGRSREPQRRRGTSNELFRSYVTAGTRRTHQRPTRQTFTPSRFSKRAPFGASAPRASCRWRHHFVPV